MPMTLSKLVNHISHLNSSNIRNSENKVHFNYNAFLHKLQVTGGL